MNKIIIKDDKIDKNVDDSIEIILEGKNNFFNVDSLKIKVKRNTSLLIEYYGDSKLDLFFNIFENVSFSLTEIKNNKKIKVQNKYYIEKNAKVNIIKFNDVSEIKEMTIINLNGENCSIDYTFKTISKDEEKYDILVYHNDRNTKSNISNNGVNIDDGKLSFNVSSFVPNGKTGCILNQDNRIINLTDNKCEIKPNLFIDENDVSASHSAHIGTFSDKELFYLQSRGISKENSINLLIKGFLNVPNKEIIKIINKYWG